ncbi:MAG: thymidine phosphorylase [Myxococcales bacterium]|nr:thymidine phosphorylase [Myxococcales bacterium]MDH3843917.1 thymidine phosphorylase [Myxococcales bacterium]
MPHRHTSLSVPELIVRKRDGGSLAKEEIAALISGFMDGSVTDYQMSALAMAVYFEGMSFEETVALTLAMRDSGKVLSLTDVTAPKVDKHSTGGVGDKVSICLAPIIASCGVAVPMMSGRGLGHTGGTLDKLEAIPGFRVNLSVKEFRAQLRSIGCALIGQTGDLAPADRRLYALRDVTGTIESIPLITASILSKKLAEGIDGLVLDVKVGRGAFMKSLSAAKELARSLVRVGQLAGKRVSALLTDMSSPIGYAIGNSLETIEAFEVLHDDGPDDLREVTFALGAEMLRIAGLTKSKAEAVRRQQAVLRDGTALRKMQAIVSAQGGDIRIVDEPDRLPVARNRSTVIAQKDGYIRDVDALELGYASMGLGAGRTRAEDPVDPGAGIRLHRRRGDRIKAGQELATLYSSKRSRLEAGAKRVGKCFEIGKRKPEPRDRIIGTIRR